MVTCIGNMYAKELNNLFEELITMLQTDTNDKLFKTKQYINAMLCYSNNKAKKYTVTQSFSLKESEEYIKEVEEALQAKLETLTIKEKKKLLDNLDVLDKLVHIIDPKNDFAHHPTHSTAQQKKRETITFEELYEIFIKEKMQESGEDVAQSTWRDYQSSYNDFIYVIEDAEDRDISSFTREDFRTFVDALHNHLPKSRTKLKQFKSLTYFKLKEITLADNEKLASNTKKKKMSTIKQMFDIALDARYGYIDTNYAEAFLIKETKKSKKKEEPERLPLSNENLNKLFNSKIYTTQLKKTLQHKPEQYWIPIIALYTGMRQNEICQLYIEDVKSEIISTGERVYYFDLNEDKDKHLKNDNAYRLVPIHPKLIELGFVDYFNSVKHKQKRLWSNLRLHPTEKRYSIDYGKNFMSYFRTYVSEDPTQVFHSFRHTVGDQLLKNAVKYKLPKDLMNRIMGHEPDKDETSQTYSRGYGIEELYTGVCSLKFEGLF